MRLKSALWVSAYLRRCATEGVVAVLRRRGAEEAGAIFVKVSRLDGSADVYGPAPQALVGEDEIGRLFAPLRGEMPMPEADAEAALRRQVDFDSDLWIVEVESPKGEHFLDLARSRF